MDRYDRKLPRLRVVIIGAGFAGLSAAKALAGAPFKVIVIDRHNYHLFQPLLYQVATAGLSPADIASPIRGILRGQRNATVILAKVSGVDVNRREVIAEGRRIPFDRLIIATGAQHAYFGNGDWEFSAPGLKTIDDATYLRRRILLAFERAETEPDPAEQRRLLNFVVVGGGPTGVEMAGAIAELARRALASDFRAIDPRLARIILVQAGPRLLPAFDPSLSAAALRSLGELGVEVRLNARVTGCDCSRVSIGQERIETRTIIWAAGVMASPARGLAWRRRGPRGAREGRSRSFRAGAPTHIHHRRHRTCTRARRTALARCCPRGETARPICRQSAGGTRDGEDSASLPLSRFRRDGDDRPQTRRGATWIVEALRVRCMDSLERGAYLLFDRLS